VPPRKTTLSYDPHSRPAASAEAIELRKRALALELRLSDDDPHVAALAIAQQSTAPKIYQVITAGYGSVKLYVEDHWIKNVAIEVTELPPIENRKPVRSTR
jgi:hypothetical protein